MSVIVFDSGVGGLTVLREARVMMPEHQFIYIGDDAGFPYGDWAEEALTDHIVSIFDSLIDTYHPSLAIIACNTASTLIMPALRNRFTIPFVGTVPAIKPAAERTRSGLVSVLGTPGTIQRRYTHELIKQFAADIDVNLVASTKLARMAENYMQQIPVDTEQLWDEIESCFIEIKGRRTDIVVLGCTHYPFLTNEMRKLAPWPVDWLDPAEAIAQRASSLIRSKTDNARVNDDIAIMSSGKPPVAIQRLLKSFGLSL